MPRALIFTALTLLGAVFFWLLPAEIFLVCVGACIGLAVVQAIPTAQPFFMTPALRQHYFSTRNGYRWGVSLLVMGACGFMVYSLREFDHNLTYADFRHTLRLVAAGGVLLGCGVFLSGQRLFSLRVSNRPQEKTRWLPLFLGIFALAILTQNNHAHPYFLKALSTHLQFGLLVGGIGLVVVGLGGNLTYQIAGREAWPVLAITTLGLVLRFWQLAGLNHRLVDEIHFMNGVVQVRYSDSLKLLHPFGHVTSFPAIYPYMQHLSVELLGKNLVGLRAVSAILGGLTIPALYLLGRGLFDHKTGLIAALWLAVMPTHLHYSRLALNNIADPLFGVLALAFMTQAFRSRRRLDFVLAGVCLGLTHYFYEGGRLLFTPLMVGWVILGFVFWRIPLKGVGITLFAACAVALPVYHTLYTLDTSYTNRLDVMGIPPDEWLTQMGQVLQGKGDAHFIDQMTRPLLLYFQNEDGSWFYGRSLLILYLVPPLLLGVGHLFWRGWQPAALLLFAWVIATTLSNSLLHQSDWSPRYVVVLPALALFAAVGLRATVPLLPLPARTMPFVTAALIASLAMFQLYGYFYDYLPENNREAWSGHTEPDDALFRAVQLPSGTKVYLIADIVIWEYNIKTMLHFYENNLQVQAILPENITQLRFSNDRAQPYAFFIDPRATGALAYLENHFILSEPQYSPYPIPREKQMVLYLARWR